jgi:hypothetical protein
MDGLTFIDHLIGHVAWPLAATGLIVFLSLRHRVAINALIHRVQKAKAGRFEIELAEAKVRADRAHLPPPTVLPRSEASNGELARPTRGQPPARLQELVRLAISDPRRAVIDSYQFLNQYALETSERLDPEQTRYTDGSPAVMRAAAVNLLAPEHADVLDRLRDAALRALGSEDEVSPGQALDYALLASRLMGFMTGRLERLQEARTAKPAG